MVNNTRDFLTPKIFPVECEEIENTEFPPSKEETGILQNPVFARFIRFGDSFNIRKLNTHEDVFYIHKTLGAVVLSNYIYRFYLLNTHHEMGLHTPLSMILLIFHSLLSFSSMFFKLSNVRNRKIPIIYPEFRLHNIVFAMRSVFCCLSFYLFQRYREDIASPVLCNMGICMLTMKIADEITRYFHFPSFHSGKSGHRLRYSLRRFFHSPSKWTASSEIDYISKKTDGDKNETNNTNNTNNHNSTCDNGGENVQNSVRENRVDNGGENWYLTALGSIFGTSKTPVKVSYTTMRNMPYDVALPPEKMDNLKKVYSYMQLYATYYMLGNINTAFIPMFAIQISSFLMTLVKKNIISPMLWHPLYFSSLLTNTLAFYTVTPIFIIKMNLACCWLSYWRMKLGYSKYLGWLLVFAFHHLCCVFLENPISNNIERIAGVGKPSDSLQQWYSFLFQTGDKMGWSMDVIMCMVILYHLFKYTPI
jgi:hypothetical protein